MMFSSDVNALKIEALTLIFFLSYLFVWVFADRARFILEILMAMPSFRRISFLFNCSNVS